MLYIYDSVLADIKRDLGAHRPERGGALLGEPGEHIITRFIFDPTAITTFSSYSPSRELNIIVQKMEVEEGLEFKGIIHSHPGSMDHPSSQDISELGTGLSLNKHMPFYLVPIVTINNIEFLQIHELALGEMKVSFYAGFLTDETGEIEFPEVSLKEMEVTLIPTGKLSRDLEELCQSINGLRNPQVYTVNHDNQPKLAGSIEIEDLFDLLLLVDVTYPASKPNILVTYLNGEQEEFHPTWSENDSFMQKLEIFIYSKIEEATSQNKGGELDAK